MIICNIEKHVGVGNLEDLRDYLIRMYNDEFIEEMVTMLSKFSQINPIKKRFYLYNESDIKKQFCVLGKHLLTWLEVCNVKPEIHIQQNLNV